MNHGEILIYHGAVRCGSINTSKYVPSAGLVSQGQSEMVGNVPESKSRAKDHVGEQLSEVTSLNFYSQLSRSSIS